MEFKFKYSLQPSDLWQFKMYYAYSSYLCLINIICIISSIALIFSLWEKSPDWFRIVLILFLSLFTVIQPLTMYLAAANQLKNNSPEIELTFDEQGMRIKMDGQTQIKRWEQILRVLIKPTMVVIYADQEHGYILTGRVMGDKQKAFVEMLREKRNLKTRFNKKK